MDGTLHAVDLGTGKARWQYATGSSVEESSPAVREGIVYVGDLDGMLHAVDAATGKARWTFKAEGEFKSSPNFSGDRIYIGRTTSISTASRPPPARSSGNSRPTARCTARPRLTRTRSTSPVATSSSGRSTRQPAEQRFSLPLGAYTGASVAVRDGQAYVGTFGNEVLGIDLAKRAIRVDLQAPDAQFPVLRVGGGGDDRVVAGRARQDGALPVRVHGQAALDVRDAGARRVVAAHRRQPRLRRVERRRLYELDLATGNKVWEFTAGAPLSASAGGGPGVLVIGSQDGILYCFGHLTL